MRLRRASALVVAGLALLAPIGATALENEAGKGSRPLLAPDAGGTAAGRRSETAVIDPSRFAISLDEAFGAFQRGYYLTALKLALPRAQKNDGAAQTLVAEIYANGLGVRRDPDEASKWYEKAANAGIPDAQLQYALMLFDGTLVKQNRDRAFLLMQRAAQAGKPLAQFNLAQMLSSSGRDREAVGWYEKAAHAKLADAQYALAQIHAEGRGGKQPDMVEARRWLSLAARSNFDTAQLDLGTWMVGGRGGPVDFEGGFAWLKRAANSGNVAAWNRVAKLYRAGVGVEADPIQAAAWYMRARQAGLINPAMDAFLDGLTEEQIKSAEQRMEILR